MYSVISKPKIIGFFKKSKYFKTNLGLVNTVEKNGERVYNERDKFAHFYNNQYKTTIYGQGNIGDIMFYLDYYIRQDVIAVYLNGTEEFVFDFDPVMAKEKTPEFYIGHILKQVDSQHEERKKQEEERKAQPVEEKTGNPDLLIKNPGAITYADLQAYLKKKQAERYSVQELPKKE